MAPEALADPDVLRVAWGALTRIVDAEGVGLLFGCSSFAGTNPGRYAAALTLLGRRHRGPRALLPGRRSREVVDLPGAGLLDREAVRRGQSELPPLLRGYLRMGGWVGDHLVIDRDLQTLHVFTGLEVERVPMARARSLRRARDGGD